MPTIFGRANPVCDLKFGQSSDLLSDHDKYKFRIASFCGFALVSAWSWIRVVSTRHAGNQIRIENGVGLGW
jgi:hypothetical protein